ncbi:hypothetical protein LAZ67_6000925 [Cordylochernes scorpioides]|uniref:Reverse transcriptase domain-containing protein n=1 Tax=Cordylochernes scorpioides TaxID=51811 RepID=A0ABY6KKU0_9ARAC|nr:hypothetical protein LAZ67_6000925 [Cordylochernes scorpioides]
MNTTDYVSKMNQILHNSDVFTLATAEDQTISNSIYRKELRILCRNKLITTDELRNFLSNLHGQAYIYGLPKVHKINIPLRPIVAFHLSPTAPLAQFLAKMIIPILKDGDVSTSISSTPKFLNHIQHLPVIPNISPTPLIIECTTEFPRTHGYSAGIITKLTSLISICLNNSIFNFDKRYNRQSKGTPMGSPLSSPLSEIVMRKIDNSITDHFPVDILSWFRYIDDIFCIVKTDSLDKIHAKLNSLYPDILFTVLDITKKYQLNSQRLQNCHENQRNKINSQRCQNTKETSKSRHCQEITRKITKLLSLSRNMLRDKAGDIVRDKKFCRYSVTKMTWQQPSCLSWAVIIE